MILMLNSLCALVLSDVLCLLCNVHVAAHAHAQMSNTLSWIMRNATARCPTLPSLQLVQLWYPRARCRRLGPSGCFLKLHDILHVPRLAIAYTFADPNHENY
jgi:hypothetical protein